MPCIVIQIVLWPQSIVAPVVRIVVQSQNWRAAAPSTVPLTLPGTNVVFFCVLGFHHNLTIKKCCSKGISPPLDKQLTGSELDLNQATEPWLKKTIRHCLNRSASDSRINKPQTRLTTTSLAFSWNSWRLSVGNCRRWVTLQCTAIRSVTQIPGCVWRKLSRLCCYPSWIAVPRCAESGLQY